MSDESTKHAQGIAGQLDKEAWNALYLAHARGDRSDLLPFPDETVQRLTNSAAGEDTARDAIAILDKVLELAKAELSIGADTRVLDFGCGWGRLTRLLLREVDAGGIYGVDVDERLVESANALLPGIDHRCIESMRPLPFEDGFFDLVFANSVFSHLSRASHEFAVGELARVLKKGGVAVLSLLDEHATRRMYDNENTRPWIEGVLGSQTELTTALENGGFHWGDTGRWHEYGLAVITETWIDEHWRALGLVPYASARGEHQRAQLFVAARKI